MPDAKHRSRQRPQRNADPVNAAIASRYSANAALTGRRTRLPVPRRRACGRTSTSKRGFQALPVNRTFVRTHAVPHYPGLLTPRAGHASRQAPQWSAAADGGTSTLRSYCAGSAIGEATVMGDANAAPNPWPAAEPCGSALECRQAFRCIERCRRNRRGW